jgi:hypothetical protein
MKRFFRYGLILSFPVLLMLSGISTSPAAAATRATRPSAPRDIRAVAGDNAATVRFLAPSSNGGSRVTGYYVKEYGRSAAIRRCTTTHCSIIGLSNGVGYRFVVAAVNRFGRSAYSAPSNVITPTSPLSTTTATITFNANGGTGTMASETETYGTSAALTLNAFTYTGYTFNGWNSEASGGGTSFTNGELVKFNGSAVLYAQWTTGSTASIVTFNANGGTGTMASETASVASALTLNAFTRSGYTFNDWNSYANGTGTSYANGATYTFTTSIVLYAQWTETTIPFTGSTSPNWSGYVLPSDSAIFTDASAEWTVPTLDCTDTPNGLASTWVGIGGYGWPTGGSSGTLLQTGTTDQCVNGVQEDFGWWEEYPSVPNYSREFNNYAVSPGDLMEAYVYQTTNGSWETLLNDLTTGLSGIMVTGEGWGVAPTGASYFTYQGTTTGLSYSGGYSAEWIVEDATPASGSGLSPFANYGSVTFSNLRTDFASWSLSASDGVEIVQSGATLSVPGPVSNDGFTVSYTGP